LAEFFLKQFSARYGKSVQGFDREAAAVLRQYGWPGNIRELKNTVRRAVVFAGEGRISAQELSLDQDMKLGNMTVRPEKEEQQILRILGQTGNNRTLTARILGISRTALYYKLRKYGIV
jgi:two-component system response regulator HydG